MVSGHLAPGEGGSGGSYRVGQVPVDIGGSTSTHSRAFLCMKSVFLSTSSRLCWYSKSGI